MKTIKSTQLPDYKPNPIFKDLPEHLKEVETYKKIEKSLIKAVLSDHTHKTVKEYVKCQRCTAKRERKSALIKEYGFTSTEQYLEWKKIMQIIINEKDFKLR